MSLISVPQINSSQLTTFVQAAMSGAAFSGNIVNYVENSGWLGDTVLSTTGGYQQVTGSKRFLDPVLVMYSGGTGAAPSARYVQDQDLALSGVLTGQITSSSLVALAATSGVLNAQITFESGLSSTGLNSLSGFVNNLSGALQTQINAGGGALSTGYSGYAADTFVDRSTDQAVSGNKVFAGVTSFVTDALFSGRAIVVNPPTGLTDAVNLGFVSGMSGVLASGGSNTSVTGSTAITAPNFTGVGSVTLSYDGTYVLVSGTASAGGVPNTVTTTGTYIMAGGYTFSGSPSVPIPTTPSGAANLLFTSGVSGTLYAQMTGLSGVLGGGVSITNNYWITGTGVVSASSNTSGSIANTFTITSGTTYVSNSGITTNTFNNSGSISVTTSGSGITNNFNGTVNNVTNLSGITGNFVNMSFWYDPTTLATGLNNAEAFVSRSFYFTGYALGAINTGTQGFLSGSFYQRTTINTKTRFLDFSLNSGTPFVAQGSFFQEISGMNRVGLDIYLVGTGISGLSIGLFGVGY